MSTIEPPLQYSVPAPSHESFWVRAATLTFVWMPVALFFTGLVSIFSGLAFTFMGIVGTPIIGLFCAYALYRFQYTRRRRRAMTVLSYLHTAIHLNLPLNEYLLAAELSEKDAVSLRLHDLRDLLARGLSVSAALYNAVPEMPAEAVAAIEAGEQLGQLQPVLDQLLSEYKLRPGEAAEEQVPFYRFYGIGVSLLVLNLVGLYMIFVMPKMKEIFRDFDADLPWATEWLLRFSSAAISDVPLLFGLLLLIVLLVFAGSVGAMLESTFILRRPSGSRVAFFDRMLWHAPLLDKVVRARALGRVCQLVSVALQAGVPLPEALKSANRLHINTQARRQVNQWRENILAGQPAAQAAANAGLPPLLVGLLGPQRTSADADAPAMSQALDFLARYYRSYFSRTVTTLRAAGEPLLVLCLGAVVGFLCYALVSPIATLIETVAREAPRGGL